MARFDLDSDTRRKLGYRVIDQIDTFFSSLPDRPVQLPADERTYGRLSNPLPEIGEDAAKVLDEICREMVDKGFHVPSANYFGLMNPTPTYVGVLAEALVAALNPQLATLARSQLASKIELETIGVRLDTKLAQHLLWLFDNMEDHGSAVFLWRGLDANILEAAA